MKYILEYFSLKPILRAFITFLIAGSTFPLVGVFIVTMDLVPLRFALMHGALLGGVIGLLLGFNNILFSLIICGIIIILLGPLSENFKIGLANISAFFMILTIAAAFILIDKLNIPAMEAFSIFWGNIYALSFLDIIFVVMISIVILIFIFFNFKKITAILYDREIAYTSGINSRVYYYSILILTGIIVALSIKIIGALLVDCLLILPAMGALYFAKSIKGMFIKASVIGIISAFFGFIFSLIFKVQSSASVTVTTVILILILYFINIFLIQKRRKKLC